MNRILAVPQATDDAADDEIVTGGVVGFVHLYVNLDFTLIGS